MAFDLPTDVMLKLVGEESLGRLHTLRAVSKHFERAASRAMGARCLSLSVRGATDELELLKLVTRLVSLRQLDISEAGEGAVQVLENLFKIDCRTSLTHLSMSGEACTQQGLEGILACKELRVLSARGCHQLGNGQISTMGSRLSYLQSVDISQTAVDDDGVTMLALLCDLRELSLRECAVSDAGLESLAQGAKNLEVLDLSRCKGKAAESGWLSCTDQGVAAISIACTRLETLVLSWCGDVSFRCVGGLSSLPRLKRLLVAGLHTQGAPDLARLSSSLTVLDVSIARPFWTISDKAIVSLCAGAYAASLSELRLVSSSVTEEGVCVLARSLPSLVLLDLTGTGVKDRGVAEIANGCTDLMVLRLNTCGGVTDVGLGHVGARLTCLRELDIKSSYVTDAALEHMCSTRGHQGALHVLSVAHCRNLTSKGLRRALRIDGGCGREIRVLNAAGLVISHDMIELLALLPQLRWLNVTDSVLEWSKECPDGVGGEGWPNAFPSINPTFEYAAVILSLPSTKLSDAHVIRPRMAESLAGSHDGDEGQREALRFPKLETLHTDRCQGLSHLLRIVASSGARSLSMVTLSGSEVQGADLLVVAQSCKNLSTLSIKRCALDQSVLESLQNRGIVIDVSSPQTED